MTLSITQTGFVKWKAWFGTSNDATHAIVYLLKTSWKLPDMRPNEVINHEVAMVGLDGLGTLNSIDGTLFRSKWGYVHE